MSILKGDAHEIDRLARDQKEAAAGSVTVPREPQAPVEHLWVVKKGYDLYVGYPRQVQARCYADALSNQDGVSVQMMTIHPLAAAPQSAPPEGGAKK